MQGIVTTENVEPIKGFEVLALPAEAVAGAHDDAELGASQAWAACRELAAGHTALERWTGRRRVIEG